jgi:hypothetical protein
MSCKSQVGKIAIIALVKKARVRETIEALINQRVKGGMRIKLLSEP